MEKHLGRELKGEERVHHINRITTDNRIKNLRLIKSQSLHIKHHAELNRDERKRKTVDLSRRSFEAWQKNKHRNTKQYK